jgi:hypothetical protein
MVNFRKIALEKASTLYENLAETEKQAFLTKFPKPTLHKIWSCSPLWVGKAGKFELILLEAQDYFQNIYGQTYNGFFYDFFMQYLQMLKNTQPVKDWYLPEAFTEEDWREVVEVERFIRLTKFKKYFEWGQADINNVLSFTQALSVSTFETTFVLDFEYFVFNLLPYRDGADSEGHLPDVAKVLRNIYATFEHIPTPQPQGIYKQMLLEYMAQQQADFEYLTRQVEARKEIGTQNIKQLQDNYIQNRKYADRVQMKFEIELNTGTFTGKLDTNRYLWVVLGFMALGIAFLLGLLFGK